MQKKVFWGSFMILGVLLDITVPLVWGIVLTLPLMVCCWWMAYRSEWFD